MDALPVIGAVACVVMGVAFFFLGLRLVVNTGFNSPEGTLSIGFAMMIAGLGLLVAVTLAWT